MRTRRLLPALLLGIPVLFLGAGCPPSTQYTDTDVEKLPKLEDMMWAHAQKCDPAFKKIGKQPYLDDDYPVMTACAERVQLTTARIKRDFSKGPEFNALADALAEHGRELANAAGAKEADKANTALVAMKDTCKSCHKKFR